MSDVTTIPTQYKAPPHLFGDHVYLPDQTERTCSQCKITKITSRWGTRNWRLPDGTMLGDVVRAPECVPVGEKAET